MRLAPKLGLSAVAAAALAGVLLWVMVFTEIRSVLQERAVAQEIVVANRLMYDVDHALALAGRDLRIIVEDEFLAEYLTASEDTRKQRRALLAPELEERMELTGPWASLMVLTTSGQHLLSVGASSGEGTIEHYPASRAAFDAALQGRFYHSDAVPSDHGPQRTVVFAAPIRSRDDNRVVGVVVAHYRWSALTAILGSAGEAAPVHLFNRRGELMAQAGHRPDGADEPVGRPSGELAAPIRHALEGGASGYTLEPGLHGRQAMLNVYVREKRVGNYRGNGWGILLDLPAAQVFGPARAIAWRIGLAGIAVLMALALALALVGRRFVSPLAALTRAAGSMGQGDFSRLLPAPRSGDEVGELAVSFNRMIDRLRTHTEALRLSEMRYRRLVDTVPDAVFTFTMPDFRTTYISAASEAILGYAPEEWLADPAFWQNHILEEDRQQTLEAARQACERREDVSIEYRMLHKNGSTVCWCQSRGTWETDAAGNPVKLHGLLSDITERKGREARLTRTSRALEALHASDRLLTRATQETQMLRGICRNVVGLTGFRFAWVGLLGPEAEGGLKFRATAQAGDGDGLSDAFPGICADEDSSSCPVWIAVRTRQAVVVPDSQGHDGTERWRAEIERHGFGSAVALPLRDGETVLGVLAIYATETDAFDTEEIALLGELCDNLAYGLAALRTQQSHAQAEQRIAHLAFHDSLTGLPNRALLVQTLGRMLARRQRVRGAVAILFVDLDDFKLANDTLGHQAGDDILRQVGNRLTDLLRASDIVARPGGDEFIIVTSSLFDRIESAAAQAGQRDDYSAEAATVAQRIVDVIKKPFEVDGKQVYLGASVGISVCPTDSRDSHELLRFADSAMYRAKELGKGGFQFYSRELSKRQQGRMDLATRLHKALENHEFVLHYQPVVELESGRIVGVEALIRWREATGTLVPPGDFLPVAEDMGLIIPIGDWVLREACQQIRRWHDDGVDLYAAVNLSVRQLWHGDIVGRVMEELRNAGISRSTLQLEVTESAMTVDPVRMEAALRQFDEQGIRIALDDFGTGYSSLDRLKHLPIETLKVDKSFVDGVTSDEDDAAIVTATIQMARSLGLRSLAEGIETVEQWQWLREAGCELGQGYYFSKAVAAAEIAAIVKEGRSWPPPWGDAVLRS